MWFATYTGVSRYEDGMFTNYTVADGLSHNRVWSMMMDSAGTIWVGTQGGVCRFDGKSFVPFPIPRAEVENPYSNLSPLLAFGMAEDQDGNLWFAMDGEGVRKFDGESFTTYTTKDGLAGNNLRAVYCDRRGRMWFGTAHSGVSCYDGTAFRNYTEKDGLTNNRIWEIQEDSAGNMWFSTLGAGACRLLEAEGYEYMIRLKANQVLERHIGHLLTRPVGRPPAAWWPRSSGTKASCFRASASS